jgi:tRNA U34 5-methylaminomethyl-2-thiouridine-forming methyltransferase MnmC
MKMEGPAGLDIEFVTTGDGSHTLHLPGLAEHYHSIHGAIAESLHIFIHAGLDQVRRSHDEISLLEIGFGTGLNALLTCIESKKKAIRVNYSSIELYPLKEDIYSKLNYPEMIDIHGADEIFRQLHSSSWNQNNPITERFSLHKIHSSLQDYIPDAGSFDLVYFDAFGPDVQPGMWSEEVFRKMALALKPGGVLVTYSSKGTVKRNLLAAGFSIEKLPGPIGKREILRATRCAFSSDG